MAERDEIDPRRQRMLAWRFARPGDGEPELPDALDATADADEPDPAPTPDAAPEPSPAEREEIGRRIRERCDELAETIDRVWAMSDRAMQARATAELVTQALRISIWLVQMSAHPRATTRFLRLAVRHFARLPAGRRSELRFATRWMRCAHPDVMDVLVEAAEAGCAVLGRAVNDGLDPEWELPAPRPDLIARLVALLDGGAAWIQRELALEALDRMCGPEAAPVLARAVRLPHVGVRWRALVLLKAHAPPEIAAPAVRWLLEDAVLHPPPDPIMEGAEFRETVDRFVEALAEAVEKFRPDGGAPPLVRIATGDCVHVRRDRYGIDDVWALRVLAAAYPDEALPLVDFNLASTSVLRRHRGANAAAALPEPFAKPRLLRAAVDGAPWVAERARALWLDRFGGPCPADPLAGLMLDLLDRPPSERLAGRLLVLDGQSPEARAAMVRVLLDEAPDREALVLLVHALDDEAPFRDVPLPEHTYGLTGACVLLYERFGTPALAALCRLALRDNASGGTHWSYALDRIVARGLDDAERALVRDVVLQIVARFAPGPHRGDLDVALRLLRPLGGAPPELQGALWSIAADPAISKATHYAALEVLPDWPAETPHGAALDARITSAIAEARAERDHERFARAAALGIARHLPAARAAVLEALDAEDDFAAVEPLGYCVFRLRHHEQLPPDWFETRLADPERLVFVIAARQTFHPVSDAVLDRLRRALDSTARSGVAAAEAAVALARLEAIDLGGSPIEAWLDRAPPPSRASLLAACIEADVPLLRLWPWLAPLLTATSEEVTEPLVEALWRKRPSFDDVPIGKVVRKVSDGGLRAMLERLTDYATEPLCYWQDEPERDEREAEEEDEAALDEYEDE